MNNTPNNANRFCSDHRPEIDIWRKPAVKICKNCGRVEPLTTSDFTGEESRSQVFHNAIKRFTPRALAASSALLALGALAYELLPARTTMGTTYPTSSVKAKKDPAPIPKPNNQIAQKAAPSLVTNTVSPHNISIEAAVKQRNEQLTTAPASEPSQQSTSVAAAIAKAIASRAITGIHIEYNSGTAYLSGKVQTQSQRLAAESAAKNVSGVYSVVSSIGVEWQE